MLIKTSFFWWVFNRRKTLENIDIFYLVAGDLHDNLVNAALLFLWVFVSAQFFFFFLNQRGPVLLSRVIEPIHLGSAMKMLYFFVLPVVS